MNRYKQINESADLAQHTLLINTAMIDTIVKSIAKIAKLKNRFVNEEKAFNNNKPDRLITLLSNELKIELEKQTVRNIKKILKDKLSVTNIKIKFETAQEIENKLGQTEESTVTLSDAYTKKLAYSVIKLLSTYCSETYPVGMLVTGLFRALEMIGKEDKGFLKIGIMPLKKLLYRFTGILIRDLSNIMPAMQEPTQLAIEYDKESNEIGDISDENNNSNSKSDIYYATSQEIAALAHSIATRLIVKLGIDTISDPGDFPDLEDKQIKSEINQYISVNYEKPRSNTEYAIFKRYIQLAYLEFKYYLESRRHKLLKSIDM